MPLPRMPHTRRTVRLLVPLLAVLGAVVALIATPATADAAPLKPVAKLDVTRYLGTWWQQATIPSFFGVRCAKDTNATYTQINATTIGVDNKCTSFTGQPDGIKGKATVIDPVTKAQLVVTFPGVPNTINPGNNPNYIVTWVGDAQGRDATAQGANSTEPYQFAIVGDPTRLSGFVLSREKVLTTDQLRMLKRRTEAAGFTSCTFLISPTTGGRSDYSPLCTV
ncbi:lipocalin family protein [Gordonia polyisoprenivorans]|uniref:lipocalin family protein n=1 Tax=Gordonia polyisoprenivorans TaxID=84595 RepID=UPI000B99ECAD|nr:lipocalin family protein [Gordonia polyisoprenivorans]OZC33656.1 lipocalin [Gordonia polyisoprenivorans]WCB38154.1 lipocalin family protein [Gordonia polyisoprenivorans]